MSEWQPIATAPICTPVLVWNSEEVAVGLKERPFASWFVANSFGYNEDGEIFGVTHWMPLPEAPQ